MSWYTRKAQKKQVNSRQVKRVSFTVRNQRWHPLKGKSEKFSQTSSNSHQGYGSVREWVSIFIINTTSNCFIVGGAAATLGCIWITWCSSRPHSWFKQLLIKSSIRFSIISRTKTTATKKILTAQWAVFSINKKKCCALMYSLWVCIVSSEQDGVVVWVL